MFLMSIQMWQELQSAAAELIPGGMRSFKHSASVLYPKPSAGTGVEVRDWESAGQAGSGQGRRALRQMACFLWFSFLTSERVSAVRQPSCQGKKETYYSSKHLIRVCGEIFPDNFVSQSAGNWDLQVSLSVVRCFF